MKAGEIGSRALKKGYDMIEEGVTYLEVVEKVEKYILERGAGLAFPTNISVNDVAAHYTPKHTDTKKVFTVGDVVKIDVGAHVDGYIADNAMTKEVGTDVHTRLIKASEEALSNAIQSVVPERKVMEIGGVAGNTIHKRGFSPIMNLTGHSLSQYVLHSGVSIPNYKDDSNTDVVSEGMAVAIEPFATTGKGFVGGNVPGNIFRYVRDRKAKTPEAEKLLKYIKENFSTLPFTERWCEGVVDEPYRNLRHLLRGGIIMAYPILRETSGGIVSQREHTLLITNEGVKVTTLFDD